MPTPTKQQRQQMAANARKAKAKLPPGHMAKCAADRKKRMKPISRNEIYSQEKLMELAGWGRIAWRRAIESGLEVAKVAGKTNVTGEAYFRWVESRAVHVEQTPSE